MERRLMMKVLTVITHPRENSLTFKIAESFIQGLKDAGHQVEILDLYRANFDPLLWEKDEPNWHATQQDYSFEVQSEMKRMEQNDGLAFVFPIWWWSMPAMMKGYIDRVWNYGFAYGLKKLNHERVLWLGLIGASQERLIKRKYDEMITRYFNVGLADFCGISNSQLELFYETNKQKSEYMEQWLNRAYHLGLNYEQNVK